MDLYREMAAHPKRDQSALIAELGLKVRTRLVDVCEHIERKNSTTKKDTIKNAKKKPTAPADVIPSDQVLAQQLVPNGGVPGQGQGGQPAGARPGAPQSFDYGPELVDIIQTVISPKTWDINGGPGAVVYYAPLRVLVIGRLAKFTLKSAACWDRCARRHEHCERLRSSLLESQPLALASNGVGCSAQE